MKPPVNNSLGGFLRILIVFLHHRRAFQQKLPIGNAALGSAIGLSDGTDILLVPDTPGARPRGLCHAISRLHGYPQRHHVTAQRRVDNGPAYSDADQIAADVFLPFFGRFRVFQQLNQSVQNRWYHRYR